MRRANIKLFGVLISTVVIFNLLLSQLLDVWPKQQLVQSPLEIQHVVVHIDLKGAPPKLRYLHYLLPMLKDNGVNGLLMEYEDMFPYEGRLVNLSAKNCYGRSQLENFIKSATQLGLEVIPLIQTFGHLEFALKVQEFSQLREDPIHPDSICPSKVESRAMVNLMLEQVVSFHNSISPLKHIHVGCDEVFEMNKCEQCKSKQTSDENLFIHYVRYISDVVSRLSPNTTVLIWDDMFRKIRPLQWKSIDYFDNIEPVYWNYEKMAKFPYLNIMNYKKKFHNNWFATAFKGADGKAATKPNMHKRYLNHLSWMTLLQNSKVPGENKAFHFKGIILTGWSRYSHMDPICELLPVAVPSLIMNLRMVKMFKSGDVNTSAIMDETSNINKYLSKNDRYFKCNTQFRHDSRFDFVNNCYFNGHKLYNLLDKFKDVVDDVNYLLQSDEISAYEYYVESNYINKNEKLLTSDIKMLNDNLAMIQNAENEIANHMSYYYEDNVINEYIASKSYTSKKRLAHIIEKLKMSLLFNGTWGERPTVSMAYSNIR